ncbi:hypothetical protein F511_34698 [Dorcoceras hygrometricum]|uniref:Uncharacterized protein n=1 Tax=Dorcoceras hygrometricum TaxID=472368 RepID=A0A2Z7CZS3_9LAMI|nr:hypothetical protein F511_34698 [Dorcoceras hygrometricum]
MSENSRRPKWHPPPPSPKILNFPGSRRTRRKQPGPAAVHHSNPSVMQRDHLSPSRGKLGNLFDQKIDGQISIVLLNSNTVASEKRERVVEEVEEEEGGHNGGCGFEEEKWRFQAEILRAECNFLRMEREFALRKLERNRVKMERTLRSAIQTLVSGKEKIFDGKNAKAVLEEEIEDLEEKIEELRKESRIKVKNCSNFDKKACILQSKLEKLGSLTQERCSMELQELAEPSSFISEGRDLDPTIQNKSSDMDRLKTKMEGLSKGVLNRVEEEYVSMLSSTANTFIISICSLMFDEQEPTIQDENKCAGRCKAIIRRIVEQVRAETEQWSQMQEMLGQVRGEMEELRTSRDFWENRALSSDYEIQTLRQSMEEWKERALNFQNKADELQLEVFSLKEEIEDRDAMLLPLKKQLENEKRVMTYSLKENYYFDKDGYALEKGVKELNDVQNNEQTQQKGLPHLSLGKHLAKEKRMVLRRLKETRQSSNIDSKQAILAQERRKIYRKRDGNLTSKHSPLQDIGNSLPATGQVHHCREVSLRSPQK